MEDYKNESLAKRCMEILTQYSEEKFVTVRSTSDLSILEEWLLIELVKSNDTIEQLKKFSNNRDQ